MPSIQIFVRSPDTYSERQFDAHLTITALKAKLEPVTGIPFGSQRLTLYASPDGLEPGSTAAGVVLEDENDKTLADHGAKDGCGIKVDNTDPHARGGEFIDTSLVDKFELTQEEYEKRQDTVLPQLKARHIGRFAPATSTEPIHKAGLQHVIGARCQLDETSERRGTIRFVGTTEFGVQGKGGEGGDWIGIELDEPTGKNDGSVAGQRYFQCRQGHGVFIRPERVLVGEYPEVDEFASDQE